MSRAAPEFGTIAARYDELRPVDAAWWEVFEAIRRAADLPGRRVLEIGCGTGAMCAALADEGARVWGLDASHEMLAVARRRLPPKVGLKAGRAEALPFAEGSFECAVMRMAVHLLERPAAFGELRRVLRPSGRLVIATPDPANFGRIWIHAYFPSFGALDRARFPSEAALRDELADAGFAAEVHRLEQTLRISRELALAKIRGRAFSTFQLLPEGEYRAGLERAEAELPDEVEYPQRWLIAVGTA